MSFSEKQRRGMLRAVRGREGVRGGSTWHVEGSTWEGGREGAVRGREGTREGAVRGREGVGGRARVGARVCSTWEGGCGREGARYAGEFTKICTSFYVIYKNMYIFFDSEHSSACEASLAERWRNSR